MNKQNGNRLKVTEKKLGLPDERRGVRGWAKYMKESRRMKSSFNLLAPPSS